MRIYELMKALRVLVIEDDALIGLLLAELLAGMGHDVCATAATEVRGCDPSGAGARRGGEPAVWPLVAT